MGACAKGCGDMSPLSRVVHVLVGVAAVCVLALSARLVHRDTPVAR
jgi:uncharacterized membrane protein YuzA (DUF378 family)